jgi:uncharacterized protein YaaR (DUF327 family)
MQKNQLNIFLLFTLTVIFQSCDSRTEVQKLSDEACECYDLRRENPTIEEFEKYSSCLRPIIDKVVNLNLSEEDQKEYTERTIECVKSKGIKIDF